MDVMMMKISGRDKMIKIRFNRGNNQPNGTFLALLQDEQCQKYLRLLSPTLLMSLCAW